MPNAPETFEELIEALTDLKFGVNDKGIELNWRRSVRKGAPISLRIIAFQDELKKLSIERLRERYEAEQREFLERLFFNQPSANADFDHWSKAAYWALEEGVALSFGKEPKRVNSDSLKQYGRLPFTQNYQKRLDLVQRAAELNLLGQTNLPGFFLGWTKTNGFEVPSELTRLVEERGQVIADWPKLLEQVNERHSKTLEWAKSEHALLEIEREAHKRALAMGREAVRERDELITALNEKIAKLETGQPGVPVPEVPIHPKSRVSLLKLVLGMAIDGYGFVPKATKSPIPKELSDLLAGFAINIDEDTIRKWLDEAAETVNYTLPDSNSP